MPSVTINEINRTVYNVRENTSDNIVYIPGIASTGPSDPTLIRDYNTFLSVFGANPNTSANIGSSWEFATNLLLEGFPVLYHRITKYKNGGSSEVVAETSKNTITLDVQETVEGETVTTTYDELEISYVYPGTAGDSYGVQFTLVNATSSVEGSLKYTVGLVDNDNNFVPLEGSNAETNVLICTIPTTVTTDADLFALIASTIESVKSNLISFKIVTPSGQTFALPTGWDSATYKFTGGSNGDMDDVAVAIATDTSLLAVLYDKNLYDIKFVTGGGATLDANYGEGYGDFYTNLANLAVTRGTCYFIPDAPKDSITEEEGETVQDFIKNAGSFDSYSTPYYPWVDFSLRVGGRKWMSPAFVYLFELAKSVNQNGNFIWQAIAGVNRGLVPECNGLSMNVTSTTLKAWQENYPKINPIMQLRNYGYAIYGQKTLEQTSTDGSVKSALEDLNVRVLANEIKRVIEYITIGLQFEGNNYDTWLSFYNQLDPYLANLKANGGLVRYEIIMDESVTTQDDINNNTVRGVVIVQITRLAEDFVIDFKLANNEADFEEYTQR